MVEASGGAPVEASGAAVPDGGGASRRVGWVSLAYAGVATAWIALSDAFVAAVASSIEAQAIWSVAKGFLFVAVTTAALHGGLRWVLAREDRARKRLLRAGEALRRYQLLAEQGREVILFVNPADGRIVDANAAAIATYGYTRDELRARCVYDLRGPGAAGLAAAQMAQADAGGILFETVHRRRDGSTFPVEVSSQGSGAGAGRVLVSVVRDVTRRKLAEEALRHSEERLALAVEAAGLGTFDAVPYGPMQWSPRAREIFGVPAEAVVADFEAFLRLLHPDDRERVRTSVVGWLDPRGEGRYHDEYRCVRPDGTVRWVLSHGIARFAEVDGERRPVRLVGTVLDVTERRRAEERLAASGRELRALVEKLPIGVFVSRAGRVVYANPTLASCLGCAHPAEIVGKRPEELLGAASPSGERAAAWSDAPPPGREWRVVRRDGRVVTLESSTARELEFEGGPAVLCTLRDLTELKAIQAQLMQSDRLASVGMLAAGVAHEINNPLAYLTAAVEFVEQRTREGAEDSPDARGELSRALADAREGAARIRHVVRDLTLFSGMRDERRVRVELAPVVESSIHLAENDIRYRARLVRRLGGAPPVLANEARLGQVLLNLLINAAQAIPEGRPDANEVRVVTGTDAQGRAVVEVQDTGTGVPADVLDRIFDPFFTTKPVGVGTGLGLSICRSIVAALGGEISAENRPEGGATFRVVLPPAPAAEAEPAPPPVASRAAGRRGRVLVVDDEPAIGNAVRRVLAPDHEMRVVASAAAARDLIAGGERFDAILCDLMMPEMTGMELHAELHRLAPDQAARMVVLTGGAFTQGARDFLEQSGLPRVEKPFDVSELRALVRTVVSP